MRDYHIHSGFVDHTDDSLENILSAAKKIGLTEIAVTEHFIWSYIVHPRSKDEKEHDTLFPDASTMPRDGRKTTNLASYFKILEESERKYGITILKGLEVDYFEKQEDQIKECISSFKPEIVLGSCHFVDDPESNNIDNLAYIGSPEHTANFIKRHGKDKMHEAYFSKIMKSVKSGMFDYIAHFDLLKRYIDEYNKETAMIYIPEIFKEMISRNVGLEINLKGLTDSVKEAYPSPEIIKVYKDLGGRKISIGSDTHRSSDLIKRAEFIKSYQHEFSE